MLTTASGVHWPVGLHASTENVMIGFRDFLPQKGAKAGTLSRRWESVSDTVIRANEWIEQEEVDVINVETVLLRHRRGKFGFSSNESVTTRSGLSIGPFGPSAQWRQVVRVWYRSDIRRESVAAALRSGEH